MKKLYELLALTSTIFLITGCGINQNINTLNENHVCYGYSCTSCEWVQWYNVCNELSSNVQCPHCNKSIVIVIN